jgi:predicted aspartyl protease
VPQLDRAPTVATISGPARHLPVCELHENGLYYISGEIDRVPCQFLLDTGATYTIIDRRIWENIPGRPSLQPAETSL